MAEKAQSERLTQIRGVAFFIDQVRPDSRAYIYLGDWHGRADIRPWEIKPVWDRRKATGNLDAPFSAAKMDMGGETTWGGATPTRYRLVKACMMQELLTGRVRLV